MTHNTVTTFTQTAYSKCRTEQHHVYGTALYTTPLYTTRNRAAPSLLSSSPPEPCASGIVAGSRRPSYYPASSTRQGRSESHRRGTFVPIHKIITNNDEQHVYTLDWATLLNNNESWVTTSDWIILVDWVNFRLDIYNPTGIGKDFGLCYTTDSAWTEMNWHESTWDAPSRWGCRGGRVYGAW